MEEEEESQTEQPETKTSLEEEHKE